MSTIVGEVPATNTGFARIGQSVRGFANRDTSGGLLLLISTIIALVWVNSRWLPHYVSLWHTSLTLGIGSSLLSGDLHYWVNDGLMTLFFLAAGLEIKRELLNGELASPRKAIVPILAAAGGVAVPALIYSAFNWNQSGAAGWGIPIATDIAFVMGVIALLGRRVPATLKVFLIALAIVDDIVAVAIIAVFYTGHIAWASLGLAAVCVAALLAINLLGVKRLLPFALLGLVLWAAVLRSGVHPTVAGVLLAMAIPYRQTPSRKHSPLIVLERGLHHWIVLLVVPLFALANAGVIFDGSSAASMLQPIPLGVVAGLLLGKPLGITLASWLAVYSGIGTLPRGINWLQLHAAAWLGGIGFTMSTFVAGLSFTDEGTLNAAKLGIIAASFFAGLSGSTLLLLASRPTSSRTVSSA